VTTYTHIACTPIKFLCALPILRTPHAPLLCVCTPCASITHASLNLHRAMLNLVHAPACQYFYVQPQILVRAPTHQYFSAQRQILARATTCQYFSARRQFLARTPIFFSAVPNFSTHTCTPIFFCATPNFSARTHTPIFFRVAPKFYISQAFHWASCIFSAPTCAHSFLCSSIPREFHCRNWGFFLNFSPIYHRHSATMKFVQFHLSNTSSTSGTTNRCGLTLLEQFFPTLNS
jgi:hypothetical protein